MSFTPYNLTQVASTLASAELQPTIAVYLNLAEHHLMLILNDAGTKILGHDSGTVDHESTLEQHPVLTLLKSQSSKDQLQQKNIVEALDRCFPFLEETAGSIRYALHHQGQPKSSEQNQDKPKRNKVRSTTTLEPSDYAKFCLRLIQAIHFYRNQFSHYAAANSAKTLADEPRAFWVQYLPDLYKVGWRQTKDRFKHLGEDMAHLDPLVNDRATKSAVPNPTFRYHLIHTPAKQTAPQLTGYGLLYLIHLCLGKKDMQEMLKQIRGFKNENDRSKQATLQVFCAFTVRLPFVRLNSQANQTTLGLDMLNELVRCPKQLFEHLLPEGQKQFRIPIDDEIDDFDTPEIEFKRHQERFIPMMMRYFDQTKAFEHLRFAVDVGDFYFSLYPKTILEDIPGQCSTEVRRLKSKMLVYDRLPNIELESKTTKWLELENNAETMRHITADDAASFQPYIVPTFPHYHWEEGHNIGLKWVKVKPQAYQLHHVTASPTSPTQGVRVAHKIHANKAQGHNNSDIRKDQPDFWLSPHEMLHLGFFQHLCQKLDISNGVENFLKAHQEALQSVLSQVAEGTLTAQKVGRDLGDYLSQNARYTANNYSYYLQKEHLPKAVVHYLEQPNPSPEKTRLKKQDALRLEYAREQLQRQIKDTKRRLDQCKADKSTDSPKAGKDRYHILKAGHMGDFIARDLMRWQPVAPNSEGKGNRGKATSLHVAKLQACLAFYGRDHELLRPLLREMRLLDDASMTHPFINGILDKDTATEPQIFTLYERYLQAKKRYLDQLNMQQVADIPYALRSNKLPAKLKDVPAHIRKLAQEHTPINLPRRIFHRPIVDLIEKLNHPELNAAISEAKAQTGQVNTLYLLKLYQLHVQNDASQTFYALPRHYRCFDRARQPEKDKPEQAILPAPMRFQHMHGTQNSTYHTLKNWSKKEPETRAKSVTNFYRNEKELRATQACDTVMYWAMCNLLDLQDTEQKSLTKETLSTLKRALTITVHGKTRSWDIVTERIPIKMLGKMRHLRKDRRLEPLLSHLPESVTRINYESIRLALEAQAHQRLIVAKAMLQFEKVVSQALEQRHIELPSPNSGNAHAQLWQLAIEHLTTTQTGWETAQHESIVIRNSLMHNQYPDPNDKYVATYPKALLMIKHCRASIEQLKLLDALKQVMLFYAQRLERNYQIICADAGLIWAATIHD